MSAALKAAAAPEPEHIPASVLLQGVLSWAADALRNATAFEICRDHQSDGTVYAQSALSDIRSARRKLDQAEALILSSPSNSTQETHND